ncbi:hypothetical protein FSB76_02875 [Mucilaginibacter ginsenosidivorax]|uniref:Uncharacterized protein n=1 Tax=Mucilaginibacter ginsenosidivorax TaxID=862126 RepID=A0A5B8VXF4_9SPHI|nr:hypothetical protein FSB76_02875 [Mucilaginibacter ginsenosidivorax]
MVIGHWSLVIGHWSLVIGHWSLVIGHWSLVIGTRACGVKALSYNKKNHRPYLAIQPDKTNELMNQ